MITVENSDLLRVMAKAPPDPEHRRVLLSFTGIGHQMGGMDVQRPEFFSAGNRFDNILFISDMTRSWGNRIDFAALFDRLSPYIAGRDLYSLGNSMGAFLAILAAAHVPLVACAAFAPQFSVSPDIVPDEKRWREYTETITDWRVPSLEGRFNSETRYYLFSAIAQSERCHWSRFPVQANLNHVVVRPATHAIARKFKEQGILSDVIAACWDDSFSPDWLAQRSGCHITTLSGAL